LGADALAVVAADGAVALDGSQALEPDARRVAERVLATGRHHVETGDGEDAVGEPVVAGGRVAGVVVAFAGTVRPPLVRATGEVAQWCAAQLELGELEASRTALAQAELDRKITRLNSSHVK